MVLILLVLAALNILMGAYQVHSQNVGSAALNFGAAVFVLAAAIIVVIREEKR